MKFYHAFDIFLDPVNTCSTFPMVILGKLQMQLARCAKNWENSKFVSHSQIGAAQAFGQSFKLLVAQKLYNCVGRSVGNANVLQSTRRTFMAYLALLPLYCNFVVKIWEHFNDERVRRWSCSLSFLGRFEQYSIHVYNDLSSISFVSYRYANVCL